MIRVNLQLHGSLRDKLPTQDKGRTELSLPAGTTIRDVLVRFDLQDSLVSYALNDEIELHPDHPLTDGDRVELFRVAGGG